MDFLTTKAIYIAVSLFISLAIASSIFFTINKINDVYKITNNITEGLDEELKGYVKYNDTELDGITMLNTAKKYIANKTVIVKFGTIIINTKANVSELELSDNSGIQPNKTYPYNKKYKTKISEESGVVTIQFN